MLVIILIPLIWLTVTALVVTTCLMSARADGRSPRPTRD
jgi:hypothetical protein